MKKIIVVLAGLVLAAPAFADLTVDVTLGSLAQGSSTNLAGTTVGANQNADFYPPVAFNETLGEVVYSFSLAMPSALSLVNNEGVFVGSDHDHFLLTSLSTSFDGTFNLADDTVGFVDEQSAFGAYPAGNYYLSIDTFGNSTEGTYDVNFEVNALTPAPSAIDLGVAGNAGDTIDMNSFGSSFDTELGLYDGLGNLLANNDDTGGTQSQIELALPQGQYYLALGGFNTAFSTLFGVSPGSSTGDYVVNVTNTPGATGTLPSSGIEWFTFQIVPEPASLALLAFGALVLVRRRQ